MLSRLRGQGEVSGGRQGKTDEPKFNLEQLTEMKETRQESCFSTLNHSLADCYDDARVIKFVVLVEMVQQARSQPQ
jgi:hypothetical protein